MANFCKFCGKELANGVCDCEAARAEKEKVKMKFDASETLNVCKRFLQNPVGMISEAASPEQKKCMLLAGGIHLAVIVDYYGAAEPPVRCGVSHLSELTEPLLEIAI